MIQFKNKKDPGGYLDIIVDIPCVAIVAGFSCYEFSKYETYNGEKFDIPNKSGKLIPFTITGEELLEYEYDPCLIVCKELKKPFVPKFIDK